MRISNNKLCLGNKKAEDLIKIYGSPLYVYESETIQKKAWQLKKLPIKIFYSVKANSNPKILEIIKKEGLGADCVSPFEVKLALKIGFNPHQIIYTSSSSSDEDLKYIVSQKVLVNLNSVSELRRYAQLFPGTKIGLRFNPLIKAGANFKVQTALPESKFGIFKTELKEALMIIEKFRLEVIMLHFHLGSGILDAKKFVKGLKTASKEIKHFPSLKAINLGGGLGVSYKPNEKSIDLKIIKEAINNILRKTNNRLEIYMEPGRFLVAESGVLLVTVNDVTRNPYKTIIRVDSGFNHLIRPTMYGSYHQILNASCVEGKKGKADIAGNLCDTGDVFAWDRKITQSEVGDILAILNAGAYGYSMGLKGYNLRPLPAEVLVEGSKHFLIRKRATLEDLIS